MEAPDANLEQSLLDHLAKRELVKATPAQGIPLSRTRTSGTSGPSGTSGTGDCLPCPLVIRSTEKVSPETETVLRALRVLLTNCLTGSETG